MSSTGSGNGTGEPSRRDTTIAIRRDVRDDLRAHKRGQESYSELIERMLDGFENSYNPVTES
jgi:hypothetical protein